MTLKVIGAGFGRTGTTSLKAALEDLGFVRCYHMQELLKRPAHAHLWERAARGESVDWHRIFADYQATVDWPACSFYQELMRVYPDAKVLLSVRDPDRWYTSVRETIYRLPTSLLMRILQLLLPHVRSMYRMIDTLVWQGTLHGRLEERDYAIEIFKRHNEAVKAHVPPERLLVYDVNEGWGPLCAFLEVPVPDRPFPHLNDKIVMQRAMRYGPAIIVGGLLAVAAAFFWMRRGLLRL